MIIQPFLEISMKRTAILLSLLFASGLAAAKAAECNAPVFPEVSTSDTSVRRVERQLKAWRSCQLKSLTAENQLEADKKDAEVNAGLEKWMSSTMAYSNGQGNSRRNMNRIEADRRKYEFDRSRERAR
jgi:hypothetical protein